MARAYPKNSTVNSTSTPQNKPLKANRGELYATAYVRWIGRFAAPLLLVAGLVSVACVLLITRLQLKTDFAELLPTNDPSVGALRRVQAHLPALEPLIINIRAAEAAQAQHFADVLVAKLRALPSDLVSLAVAHLKEEKAWFEQHQGLYVASHTLQDLLADLNQLERRAAHNPLVEDLDAAPSSSPPAATWQAWEQRLQQQNSAHNGLGVLQHLPAGYFSTADGKTTSVVVLPPGGMFHEHAGERLHAAVLQLLQELNYPSFGVQEVGLSGDIESNLEERDALENDLLWATALSVGLICTLIWLFFGSWRALPLLAMPAFFGSLVAYGFAQLAFGYLNSSTAFLASIIVGNGVNFAIIQLARYEEERRGGASVTLALQRSLHYTVQATGLAAMAASIAYGSLTVTQFRGFSQFGLIGGLGMMTAWLATLILLPACLWLLDKRQAQQRSIDVVARSALLARPLVQVVTRAPYALLGMAGVFTVLCLLCVAHFMQDPFEYNFRHLRSSSSDDVTHGEARWYQANGQVFGRALNPLVVLAHTPESLPQLKAALWQADTQQSGAPMLDTLLSLDDLLPGSRAEQARKLPLLAAIRARLRSPAMQRLPAAQRARLQALTPPADLQPIGEADLPSLVRRFFTEVDGRTGRVLMVFPKVAGYNPWDGRDMLRLDARVGTIVTAPGQAPEHTVGAAMLFSGMIRSIVHDGPLATLVSACGVSLLVVLYLRRRPMGMLFVLATLSTGFVWMLGMAALLHLHINFLNFVALPVTLGIGVDYGINIYMRAQLEGAGRLQHAVYATGAAVALCSATTIIGYGALLVADNRGLRSFGTLAILGEVACVFTALLVMPACLYVRESYLSRRQQQHS